VSNQKRTATENNHSATHLLHYALRQVLGTHVEQKGSLVHPDYLRFDFSHFQKMTDEEIKKVEALVNKMIRDNSPANISQKSFKEAKESGAMAIFGEKYGDVVRVVRFGDSIELCGGTHVKNTGQIGLFKIISESAISAGVRRIEAITAGKAEEYVNNQIEELEKIRQLINSPKNPAQSIRKLLEENNKLAKELEGYAREKQKAVKEKLKKEAIKAHEATIILGQIEIESTDLMRDLAFQLKSEIPDLFLVIGAEINDKPNLMVMISEKIMKGKNLNAVDIIREAAKEIQGGGGGQPFFATAGGKNSKGIGKAIEKALSFIYVS